MPNAKVHALNKKLGKAKSRVIGAVGSALSAPTRARYARKGVSADRKRGILKKARAYDDAPNFDERGNPTDAFKVRSAAKDIRNSYKRK